MGRTLTIFTLPAMPLLNCVCVGSFGNGKLAEQFDREHVHIDGLVAAATVGGDRNRSTVDEHLGKTGSKPTN